MSNKEFKRLEPYEEFEKRIYNGNNDSVPFYDNRADYNTNSNSYYDDLARKTHLIRILAKRIWEYDEELAKRFEEWDKNLEEFPKEVEKLLIKWLDDGTLDDIINKNIFKDLNKDIRGIKEIISELKDKDNKQDKKIDSTNNRITETESKLNDRLDNIISPNPIDVVEDEDELEDKYPDGAEGVVVVKENGHYYYYQEDEWHKGGEYIANTVYELVNSDGTVQNLNSESSWSDNPDISSLNTGFYSAFIQSSEDDDNYNDNYPIIKNAPEDIEGAACLIKVFKHDYDDRKHFEVIVNFSNDLYTATKSAGGEMSEWALTLKTKPSKELQQYNLTYYNGEIKSIVSADERNEDNKLNIPITEMPTGFYYGQIPDNNGAIDRELPHDIIYSGNYTFLIYRNYDGRVSINLHDNTSKRSWVCYNLTDGTEIIWKRLDVETDLFELEKAKFTHKVNRISNDNFKSLVIADTHIQHLANTIQVASVNDDNMNDFYDISKSLKNNDIDVHLGDWVDGNFDKDNTITTLDKLSREFYKKSNRYGVYGNHDYNSQWDGFAGENGKYKYDLKRLFDKHDMSLYYTPLNKDYYYIDYEKKNIRLIFLNTFDISYKTDEKGHIYIDPLNTNCIGAEQIKWLITTLNNVPKDYNVIIYTHNTFTGVFDEFEQYNGDATRKVLELYQSKEKGEISTTDIDETLEVYDYYKIEEEVNLENANGKILGVINGHRHKDESINKKNIRYISLLCARAESGDSEQKPEREYFKHSRNAISFLEFDEDKEEVNILRYGAGVEEQRYKMFE